MATSEGRALSFGAYTMQTLIGHKEIRCLAQTTSAELMLLKAEVERVAALQGHRE